MALESQTLKGVVEWRKTYEKLYEAIKAINKDTAKNSKEAKVLAMLKQFEAFCQEYIEELSKFSPIRAADELQRSVEEALWRYWQPVLLAAKQNEIKEYEKYLASGYAKLEELQSNLKKRLVFTTDVQIVLYFENDIARAKRFIFKDIFLIGVPWADALKRDWMSIPHELGHHVFWSTKFSLEDNGPTAIPGQNFLESEVTAAVNSLVGHIHKDNLAKMQVLVKEMLDGWTEEIFADVVGARIAEDKFVNAAYGRVLQQAKVEEDLYTSDGEHPILYLLPYIRHYAWFGSGEPKRLPFKDSLKITVESLGFPDQSTEPRSLSISLTILRGSVIATFVEQIKTKLKNAKFDQLTAGTSPLDELSKFIGDDESDPKDERRLTELLNLPILERNEFWYCRKKRHPNVSSQAACAVCGARAPGWIWKLIRRRVR